MHAATIITIPEAEFSVGGSAVPTEAKINNQTA
jgi:hypothetical protein